MVVLGLEGEADSPPMEGSGGLAVGPEHGQLQTVLAVPDSFVWSSKT